MPLDLAAIAATAVTSFLVPRLKEGAQTLANKLGERIGDAAGGALAGTADRIWERIKSAFSSDRERQALENFAQDPELYAQPVEQLLDQKVREDPELAEDLRAMLEADVAGAGRPAWQIMGANAGVVTMDRPVFQGGEQVIGGHVHQGQQQQAAVRNEPRPQRPTPPTAQA